MTLLGRSVSGDGAPGASGKRLWVALIALSVSSSAVVSAVRPNLAYRVLDLELGNAVIGVAGGAYAIAPIVLGSALGTIADGLGARRVARLGVLLMGLGVAVLSESSNGSWLTIGMAVLGTGHFLLLVSLQMLASWIGTRSGDYHKVFGVFSFSLSVGQVLGPASLLLPQIGMGESATTLFLRMLAILTLTSALFGLLVPRAAREQASESVGSSAWLELLVRVPRLARIMAISGLAVASMDATSLFLPTVGESAGLTPAEVGGLLMLRAGSSGIVRIGLSRLIGLVGAEATCIAGFVMAAIAMGSMAQAGSLIGMGMAIILFGVGVGVADPITGAWTAEVVAARGGQGSAAALRVTTNRVSQLMIPMGAAAIGATGGVALWVVAGCVLVAAVLAVRVGPSRNLEGH